MRWCNKIYYKQYAWIYFSPITSMEGFYREKRSNTLLNMQSQNVSPKNRPTPSFFCLKAKKFIVFVAELQLADRIQMKTVGRNEFKGL